MNGHYNQFITSLQTHVVNLPELIWDIDIGYIYLARSMFFSLFFFRKIVPDLNKKTKKNILKYFFVFLVFSKKNNEKTRFKKTFLCFFVFFVFFKNRYQPKQKKQKNVEPPLFLRPLSQLLRYINTFDAIYRYTIDRGIDRAKFQIKGKKFVIKLKRN